MSQTSGSSALPDTTVEREGVVVVQPKPRLVQMPQAAAPAPQPMAAPAPPSRPTAPPRTDSAAIGALTAIAAVLAARLLLLLAVAFGFVLGLQAMGHQTWTSLAILCAWCALTILPLVYLDLKVRHA